MAKIHSWNRGIKEGFRSQGLTDQNASTLDHVRYSPDSGQLESDRPLQTTLSSLYLGGQHKMSSGGENVFFTNLDSNVSWNPMWGGVKDQSILENQDSTGIIRPSGRVYGRTLVSTEFWGPVDLTADKIDWSVTVPTPRGLAFYGLDIIIGEDIEPTDVLFFTAYHSHTSHATKAIYSQQITDMTLADGDILRWWFDHPVELHQDNYTLAIYLFHGGIPPYFGIDDTPDTMFLRTYQASLLAAPWTTVFTRTFRDKDLSFTEGLGCSEWAMVHLMSPVPNTLHLSNLEMLVTDDCIPIVFNN